MSQKLNVAVIGCGVIGRKHIEAAITLPQVELVAIADINEQALQQIATQYGVKKTYTDAESLLGDSEVEAVVLALPTNIRSKLALETLRQHKHLLLEKPAAMNSSELQQLLDLQTSQKIACASSRFALYESAFKAAEVVQSGELGPLRLVRCRALIPAKPAPDVLPPAWRLKRSMNGGGILLNWGVYDLDYLMALTAWQLKPQEILAQTWAIPESYQPHVVANSDAETYIAAFIRCEGGEVISFERGEYMAASKDEAWQLVGEKGSLRMRMVPDKPKEIFLDKADAKHGVLSESIWQGQESYADIHMRPLDDFATAILEEKEPSTGLKQALQIQKLTDAIYTSAEQGKAITI